MVKRKKRNGMAWFLIILGLLGVYLPHIGFLANLIPSLDVISHSVLEIASATIILVGILLKE